jgi:hypothetical protein
MGSPVPHPKSRTRAPRASPLKMNSTYFRAPKFLGAACHSSAMAS